MNFKFLLKNILLITTFIAIKPVWAQEKRVVVKVMYFNEMMGNVHQNTSRYSQTLTTISCNHPVKVQKIVGVDKKEQVSFGNGEWLAVNVGPYDGYILSGLLSDKKQECFQDRFPKFFDEMQLSLTDLYYLGRLNDQYMTGKSKAGGE